MTRPEQARAKEGALSGGTSSSFVLSFTCQPQIENKVTDGDTTFLTLTRCSFVYLFLVLMQLCIRHEERLVHWISTHYWMSYSIDHSLSLRH